MLLSELWHTYGSFAGILGGGGVLGWYGRIASVKAQQRHDRLQAGAQALQLNAEMAKREAILVEQLDQLRKTHWRLLAQTEDVYAEAIAARLIVHDLDAEAGRAMREFQILPAYPFPMCANNNASIESDETRKTPFLK